MAMRFIKREPDFVIGGKDNPYLLRWWIIPRNRFFNIYLHKFLRDDDDRALHDHPYVSCSIILKGGYIEHMPYDIHTRKQGQIIFRRAKQAHRIQLLRTGDHVLPAWSLFITGPRIREWGFHCPNGWVHWKVFTASDDKGAVGRGCD